MPTEKTKNAAAVAVINTANKVLLMKRVADDGDDWVYPGGSVEQGESFDIAARREVLEEAGILLSEEANKLFPLANYITAPDRFGMTHDLLVYITRYGGSQPDPYIASPNEMVEWGWFDPRDVLERAARGEMKILPSGIFAIQRIVEYLSSEKVRNYGEVLMGGTFDRLHEGHKQLLQRAFEVGDYVYIGLTTDGYIERSKKQFKEIVTDYEKRLFELRRYLSKLGLLSRAIILPLDDTAGPKALDSKLGALVISEETVAGGDFVNSLRIQNEVPAMELVIVSLLKDELGEVISSTRLRRHEISGQ